MRAGPGAGRPAVFLDRDGVLNRPEVRAGRPHPPDALEKFVLYDDVPAGCARLRAAGFELVVVTNQPDVGRGTQRREVVEAMHAWLRRALPALGRVEVCYHAGREHGEPCACRKPLPGMVLRAAAELGLDLTASFLVGDRWRDVDCGHAAGCRTVFLDRGYAERLRQAPDYQVRSFAEAVDCILAAVAGPGAPARGKGLPPIAPPA